MHYNDHLGAPEWDSFSEQVAKRRDWAHPEVGAAAQALHDKMAGTPGLLYAFRITSWSSYEMWMEEPFSVPPNDEFWIQRTHGIIAYHVARVIAHCPLRDAEPAQHEVLVNEMMRQVNLTWKSEFALVEHTPWRLSFWDAAAVWATAQLRRVYCPKGQWLAENVIAAARRGELEGVRLPPARELVSWWPAASWCAFLHGSAPQRPGDNDPKGLRVVVVETHHADFREACSLLDAVSLELRGFNASIVSYLLLVDGGDNALSIGELGFPETRANNIHQNLEDLTAGLALVQGWLSGDEFFRTADAVVDCNPLWVCVLVRRLMETLPIVSRTNMAILQHYQAWDELDVFWSWFAAFAASPWTAMATKSRIMAEQAFAQTGVRPEYVPMVMYHLRGITYQPTTQEVLVFKNSHPGFKQFRAILSYAVQDSGVPLAFHQDILEKTGPLSYEAIASYRAIVLVPHVPNSCSFADVYALQAPLLLPAEPYIYTWMWASSSVFGGPGPRPLMRSVAPSSLRARPPAWWLSLEGEATPHPYSALEHLEIKFPLRLLEKAYWFQYSDYAVLPGLQRFRSIAELVELVGALSQEKAAEVSRAMRLAHERRVHEVTRWAVCVLRRLEASTLGRDSTWA